MDRPGRNPCEQLRNCGSYMASRMICNPFCTIFSLGEPTPKGLVSFFPGLGMRTLLAGVKLNFPDFSSSAVSMNHAWSIPSRVSIVIPLLMFPGFAFINI